MPREARLTHAQWNRSWLGASVHLFTEIFAFVDGRPPPGVTVQNVFMIVDRQNRIKTNAASCKSLFLPGSNIILPHSPQNKHKWRQLVHLLAHWSIGIGGCQHNRSFASREAAAIVFYKNFFAGHLEIADLGLAARYLDWRNKL